jgi:predicted secreted protein
MSSRSSRPLGRRVSGKRRSRIPRAVRMFSGAVLGVSLTIFAKAVYAVLGANGCSDLATKQTEATQTANKTLNNLIMGRFHLFRSHSHSFLSLREKSETHRAAYNELLEIKNQAIEQKMKMTTRFKRAGEELSAQCVDLQASTTQLHLNKRRKGRSLSRGVSMEENGKGGG